VCAAMLELGSAHGNRGRPSLTASLLSLTMSASASKVVDATSSSAVTQPFVIQLLVVQLVVVQLVVVQLLVVQLLVVQLLVVQLLVIQLAVFFGRRPSAGKGGAV